MQCNCLFSSCSRFSKFIQWMIHQTSFWRSWLIGGKKSIFFPALQKCWSLFTFCIGDQISKYCFFWQSHSVSRHKNPPTWFKRVLTREVRLLLNTKAPVCLTVYMNLWPASTNLYNPVQLMTDSGSEMTIKPLCLWTSLLLEGLDWKVIVNLLTLLFHAHESSVSQIVVQMLKDMWGTYLCLLWR